MQSFAITATPNSTSTSSSSSLQAPVFHIRTAIAAYGKKAVVRNRARRRLREAARHVLGAHARRDFAYLIHGTPEALYTPWKELLAEYVDVLRRMDLYVDGAAAGDAN